MSCIYNIICNYAYEKSILIDSVCLPLMKELGYVK